MKVAYIFHGHSRTWDKCHTNFFENVFSVVPGDIFIHTWDATNSVFGSTWNGFRPLTEEQLKLANRVPNFNEIYNTYKPKVFIIESDKCKNIKNQSDTVSSHLGLYYMLEGSKKIYNEVIQHDNYDYIFETRLDINYKSKLDLMEFNNKNLMCPIEGGLLYDFWMFGSVANMKIKIDFFDNVKSYWYDKNPTLIWYEHALENYLRDNGISFMKSSLEYDVPRLF
jgi:hypothetical protein